MPARLTGPCLACGWLQVWYDEARERSGDGSYLSLWRPVPAAGYIPMGLVAGLGPYPPSPSLRIR